MFKNSPGVNTVMINFPHAKINIGLNVTARRPDGYHNLETVFYPAKIYDVLEVIEGKELTFEASGLGIPGRMEDNLCVKGYHLLKQDFDLPPVNIYLHKHIPIGAGLGGGSADASFFIRLMNEKFGLGLQADGMMDYARQLGADCSFFIEGKPVFAYDKGDRFRPLELDLGAYKMVLVMPDAHVSTAEAYRGVKPVTVSESLIDLVKMPLTAWKSHIKNDFEHHIFNNHPVIRGVKAELYKHGAIYASMSGSGASVFGIFEELPDLSDMANGNQMFYNI